MDPADSNAESDESGKRLRCELVPLPQRHSGNFWTKTPPPPPPLALDIGAGGAVRVTDRQTNALLASASLAQMTATPARYTSGGGEYARHTDPLLIVGVPGLQPLRIRPAPMKYGITYTEGTYRYNWRDIDGGPDRPAIAEQPTYGVAEAEWLALIEIFGLGHRVVDEQASGGVQRRAIAR